jgi:hypothetical protein
MTPDQFRENLQELVDYSELAPADLLAALEEQCEVMRGEIMRQERDKPTDRAEVVREPGVGTGPQRGAKPADSSEDE